MSYGQPTNRGLNVLGAGGRAFKSPRPDQRKQVLYLQCWVLTRLALCSAKSPSVITLRDSWRPSTAYTAAFVHKQRRFPETLRNQNRLGFPQDQAYALAVETQLRGTGASATMIETQVRPYCLTVWRHSAAFHYFTMDLELADRPCGNLHSRPKFYTRFRAFLATTPRSL
jgi:hypothetical protein